MTTTTKPTRQRILFTRFLIDILLKHEQSVLPVSLKTRLEMYRDDLSALYGGLKAKRRLSGASGFLDTAKTGVKQAKHRRAFGEAIERDATELMKVSRKGVKRWQR